MQHLRECFNFVWGKPCVTNHLYMCDGKNKCKLPDDICGIKLSANSNFNDSNINLPQHQSPTSYKSLLKASEENILGQANAAMTAENGSV